MKIYLCDVNFGECILYSGRNRLLVSDCGARFGQDGASAGAAACAALQRGMTALQTRRPFAEKALVITHLDADHYNGVLTLPEEERFQRVYLPWYYYKKDKEGRYETGGLFYRMAWARAFFYLTGHPGKLTMMQELFLRLPSLLAEGGTVQCVAQGDTMRGAGTTFRVLWPHRQAELSRTEALLDRLRALLADVLRRMGKGREEHELYLAVLERYAGCLLELYDFYASPRRRAETPEQHAQDRARREDAVRGAFAALRALPGLELTRSEAGQSGYVTRELLQEMNACSIVFERPEQLLACGDATPDVLRYLNVKGLLGEQYRAVKLPCHGVEAYFSPELPQAEVGLVSNSGPHRSDWKISAFYRESRIGLMCCTNNSGKRCALYNEGMPEQCEACGIWDGGRDRCITLQPDKKAKILK